MRMNLSRASTSHSSHRPRRCGAVLGAGLLACACALPASADIETLLASYEPYETDLTVTRGSQDAGLTVTPVLGGRNGVPPATHGEYVLKVDFVNEDGKVEFRHDWSASTYDLAGESVLLADVFIATPSALPGVMGIWSSNWSPPDAWQPATNLPTQVGVWTTVSVDLRGRTQTGLNELAAFVFQDMPGPTGTAYVDNVRLRHAGPTPAPRALAANAFPDRNELTWHPVPDTGLQGYNVYRATAESGPYVRLNATPIVERGYSDRLTAGAPRYFYRVTAVAGGPESPPSNTVSALYNGLTDEQMLDLEQHAAFRYFWDFAHPISGMARDSLTQGSDTCATGGTGMGLMAIVVAVERGWVDRAAAAAQVLKIITFLENSATRYHGAWAHWINGSTGQTIPFSQYDDGGDIVETADLAQGLLTVRQYFTAPDSVEWQVRTGATRLWQGIEWDWYRRYPDSPVVYWHWSPNFGWAMNMPIRGYMEAMNVYLLAISSPTHPIPASCYTQGWAGASDYANGNTYFGYPLYAGPTLGGPLFFTQYSFLGFDPRYKHDACCNYFVNARNISLIQRAYSIVNRWDYAGYNRWLWGLTACAAPPPLWYSACSPTNDSGTVAPTAALAAMPFAPAESLATLRYLYDTYGTWLWGPYGFRDALNPQQSWLSDTYIAIDQGPIVVMLENYRTGLCWRLFMANPEIRPMMTAIGMISDVDFDANGAVDYADWTAMAGCVSGPGQPAGCPGAAGADLDGDGDIDLADLAIFQTQFTGS